MLNSGLVSYSLRDFDDLTGNNIKDNRKGRSVGRSLVVDFDRTASTPGKLLQPVNILREKAAITGRKVEIRYGVLWRDHSAKPGMCNMIVTPNDDMFYIDEVYFEILELNTFGVRPIADEDGLIIGGAYKLPPKVLRTSRELRELRAKEKFFYLDNFPEVSYEIYCPLLLYLE